MKNRRFFAKRWGRYLVIVGFSLIFLGAGCQVVDQAENQSGGKDQIIIEECFVCREEKESALSLYRGQNNLGIIDLNTFDLAPVTINQYDDFGELIETLSEGSVTHITNIGEKGFSLSVTANSNRGYADGCLSFHEEALDMEKAASYLCSNCLKRTMSYCWSDMPLSVGVIDFSTGEIRLFEEKILAFTFGDYYISCSSQEAEDNENMRNLDLLIFYCPERY